MLSWIIASLAGTGLGLALFACVRLRMHFGSIVRERFGNLARQIYWLVTIIVMVVFANLGLIGLRMALAEQPNFSNPFIHELWFIVLAVGIAFYLIQRQLAKDNCKGVEQ